MLHHHHGTKPPLPEVNWAADIVVLLGAAPAAAADTA
jgi:hypothetical protein